MTYWRIYYSHDVLEKSAAIREEHTIQSTGVGIHLDVYPQKEQNAPVFIFNHGGGGYSRIFIPIALEMHQRGYTVVLPDQYGQGLSEGKRGDFTIDLFVQNIVDSARWAAARFGGDVYMGGGSVGSGLTYYAAAQGAPVKAIICHNLYQFDSLADSLALSRFASLSWLPLAAPMKLIAGLLPGLKIPFQLLGRFEDMVDDRAKIGFYQKWKSDPHPIRRVSMRYIRSTFTTKPAIPLEENTIPALVINPIEDRMVKPEVTRRNYERLGGKKHYAEIPYGHWATGDKYVQDWCNVVNDYIMALRGDEGGG